MGVDLGLADGLAGFYGNDRHAGLAPAFVGNADHRGLADGRELLASPGHKTADGRVLGSLAAGDRLDGSTIKLWELVPYSGDRTYDLLPAGATGAYWANGVLLGSTLAAAS